MATISPPTIRHRKIRQSFDAGDKVGSRKAHDAIFYERGHKSHSAAETGIYTKNTIESGCYGVVTTCALACAASGAGNVLSTAVLLSVGLSLLIGNGISIAIIEYRRRMTEIKLIISERKREQWECENYLEGEQREMIELYHSKGMTREEATAVVNLLSKYQELFVDVMMAEELGYPPLATYQNPFTAALITAVSYILFGLLPFVLPALAAAQCFALPQLAMELMHCSGPVLVMSISTIILLILGAWRSKFYVERWWQSAFGTVLAGWSAGGLAYASSAYLVGVFAPWA